MIFKVQRPIFHTDMKGFWLYYDQNKQYTYTRVPTKQEQLIMGSFNKVYIDYTNYTATTIISEVEQQSW